MNNKIQYISNGITKEITKDELIIMLNDRIKKAIAFIKSEKVIKCSGIPIKDFEAYENYLLSVLEGSDKE